MTVNIFSIIEDNFLILKKIIGTPQEEHRSVREQTVVAQNSMHMTVTCWIYLCPYLK
jgi:hypothetical protein